MDKADQILYAESRKIKSKILQKEKEISRLKISLSEIERRIIKE